MGKTLYLECSSGISGDMTVAALLDLGADKEVLLKSVESLKLDGYEIKITDVVKSGIKACDFDVVLDEHHENHDHDMEYLHGKGDHHHHHDHDHQHEHHHHHHHEHRHFTDIVEIINNSQITAGAKNISLKIFDILADSEAKAHGTSKEEVAFHEVGAVDSIIDIVSVGVCIDNLGIDKVIVPVLNEGKGTVRCQHGILPVPVPAVLNIVSKYSIKLNITDYNGEFVTPTGAAIVAALSTSSKLPEEFTITKVGIGAGKRNYEKPSLLRAMLIEDGKNGEIYKLETNIDDCSGEAMGYIVEKVFEAGAKDIYFTPVFMKKNRPAYVLNVICEYGDISAVEDVIFKHTTTIGIRRMKVERTVLNREIITVSTRYGEAKVKKCTKGEDIKYYPEFSSVSAICDKYNLSFQDVYNNVVADCKSAE